MEAHRKSAFDSYGFKAALNATGRERALNRSRWEKNRFWIEQPARRFVVYFCVLVAAETVVVSTLHWIFHFV